MVRPCSAPADAAGTAIAWRKVERDRPLPAIRAVPDPEAGTEPPEIAVAVQPASVANVPLAMVVVTPERVTRAPSFQMRIVRSVNSSMEQAAAVPTNGISRAGRLLRVVPR